MIHEQPAARNFETVNFTLLIQTAVFDAEIILFQPYVSFSGSV